MNAKSVENSPVKCHAPPYKCWRGCSEFRIPYIATELTAAADYLIFFSICLKGEIPLLSSGI